MVEAVPPDDDSPATTTATMTSFPAVLFDGDREMDVGNINVHPDLLFKQFQTALSQLIGISYNNLTTYLVDSNKSKFAPDRRKILITGKTNFAAIAREKNCYFFVVLKRSRRDRRRKPVKQREIDFQFSSTPSVFSGEFDGSRIGWNNNRHVLNDSHLSQLSVRTVPRPYYYEDRFHDLLMQSENYMNMNMNMIYDSRYGSNGIDPRLSVNFPRIEDAYPRVQNQNQNQSNPDRSLCDDCTLAQKLGEKPEFHCCVYDEIVVGHFRSPAGPIARPR